MHVVTLLKADMFDVEIDGKPASIAQALPDWNPHDRFGLVIDDALGGIGATHLLQIAITAFYDIKPSRRTEPSVEVSASGTSSAKASMPIVMNLRFTTSAAIAFQSKNWSTPTYVERCRKP